MAYLVFKKEEGLAKDITTFIKASKTDADLQLVHNNHTSSVDVVNITDTEYDDFINGDKNLTVVNEIPSFVDMVWSNSPDEEQLLNQESFEDDLEKWKKELLARVNKVSSHSQIGKVTTALDFITNLDLSSISYPTSDVAHKLKMDNKYVDLRCI